MHLLFLADGLFPFVVGGMQKHSTMLIKHLSPLVDQVTLCTCGAINAAPPLERDVLMELVTSIDNIEVRTCAFEDHGKLPGHYLRASRQLSQNFLKLAGDLKQYDCIYAQGLTGDAFLKKHPKVVLNLHGLEMFQPSFSGGEAMAKQLMRPHFRRQIRQAWKLVSLGGRLGGILIANGASQSQIVVLPNGVDDDWFDSPKLKRSEGPIRFLMVGRNEHRKGYHVLRQALARVEKPIELHLVGDWPQIESTRHKLTYHGVVRDKKEVMAIMDSCDVLLVPSLAEGMPTVVLEAKARGLQIIGTAVGAMEVLESNLLPPGDSSALAKAMTLERDLKQSETLSDRFRWTQVAAATVESLTDDT